MRSIKSFIRCAVSRIKETVSSVSCKVAVAVGTFAVADAMASSKGAAGFTKATQEISSYETPVSNLMKAIAAVIVLVGAFNVYFKMQNGDQDVKKTIMLTGDRKNVADYVAKDLGIQEVYSELLPGDKVSKVEELLDRKTEKEKLAFVGDGINDAPVLSRADIGIAMGALGSDAAIEAADIVLMDDDPLKIAKAIRISRKCIRIVYENIYFAIGIKVICLILGALGIANMWAAIFADVGVMVIAVLNAIRALFVKRL